MVEVYLVYFNCRELCRKYNFEFTLNSFSDTLTSINDESKFQTRALLVENLSLPLDIYNSFECLVLYLWTLFFEMYDSFITLGSKPFVCLYMNILLKYSLSKGKIDRSINNGSV